MAVVYKDYFEEIQEIEDYDNKFKSAMECVESNPISNLMSQVKPVHDTIKELNFEGWDDDASGGAKKAVQSLETTLWNFYTELRDVYSEAEKLYIRGYQITQSLKKTQSEYKEYYDDEPKQADYTQKNFFLQTVEDTAAFNLAHSQWEDNCIIYDSKCSSFADAITEIVSLLKGVNAVDPTSSTHFNEDVAALILSMQEFNADSNLMDTVAEIMMLDKGYVRVSDPSEIQQLAKDYGIPLDEESLEDISTGETHKLDFWIKEEDINGVSVPIVVVFDDHSESCGQGTMLEYVEKLDSSIVFFNETVPGNVLQRMLDTKAIHGIKFDQTPYADTASQRGTDGNISFLGGAYYSYNGYVAMHNSNNVNFMHHAVSHELGHAFDQTVAREVTGVYTPTAMYSNRNENLEFDTGNSTFVQFTDRMDTFYEGLQFDGCQEFKWNDYPESRAGTSLESRLRIGEWEKEHFANTFRIFLEEPDKLQTVDPDLYQYMANLVEGV